MLNSRTLSFSSLLIGIATPTYAFFSIQGWIIWFQFPSYRDRNSYEFCSPFESYEKAVSVPFLSGSQLLQKPGYMAFLIIGFSSLLIGIATPTRKKAAVH